VYPATRHPAPRYLAIRRYREAKRISQAHLACLVGSHQSKICLIEQGLQIPTEQTLNAIAAVLDVSPAFLLLVPVEDAQAAEPVR
jgi:transcriptional regulator with XRE-family HTH domain